MLDLTNSIYTKIKSAVKAVYPNAIVEKTYQATSTKFPYVTITDIDNPEIGRNLSGTGKQSSPSWQIDVYASGSTGEIVAKEIRDAIIPVMEDLFFCNRDTSRPTVNAADTTIYRWTLRYSCKVDEDTECIY